MKQWWARHPDLDLRGLRKRYIEDFAGRIPLLLNMCVVDKPPESSRLDETTGAVEEPIEPSQLGKIACVPKKWIDLDRLEGIGQIAKAFANRVKGNAKSSFDWKT
jgi:hypothetical protein